jgi:pimeloyl-ACP methyl ester carboxylesterase
MKVKLSTLFLITACACMAPLYALQAGPPADPNIGRTGRAPMGPVKSPTFHTTYIRLGSNNDDGLLYEPEKLGPNARIALVYEHPGGNNFNVEVGPEMASRGYRVLMVNYRGKEESVASFAKGISRGISFLRSLPGVQKVVVSGHSGGGHLIAFYANVAEHGPAACQVPGILYPCKSEDVTDLAKPDGVVLLDPTLGAFHAMSTIDPAWDGKGRSKTGFDMYATSNGYDPKSGSAKYSADFSKIFHAAQSGRNMQIVDNAVARLKLIEQGKGSFTDDEPLVIPAANEGGQGIRLYHADLSFVSHTKRPHMLLKADGSTPEVIIQSVRPATAARNLRSIGSLDAMSINTTVRFFLANYALRTTEDFEIKQDDIVGVDWASSMNSTAGSAPGISVPTLVLTMGCHYLIVPGEIVYDRLSSKDKTYATVEGSAHSFAPCKPEYGDTQKRTFDFVDNWLSKAGRF